MKVKESEIQHVAALDGIRGLAILLVYCFHYLGGSSSRLGVMAIVGKIKEAGWSGVDLFFVLSGYLITTILMNTRNDEWRARNFYVRRALRIFPIYYTLAVMLFVAAPFISAHWRPGHIAFLFYGQNFAGQVDGTLCSPSPYIELTHLWSLAIEEQFYLIWPLLVWHLRPRTLLAVAACIVVIMPIMRIEFEHIAYFIFRYDGFAMGAALAISLKAGVPARRAQWMILFGIAFFALSTLRGSALANDPPMLTFGITLIEAAWVGLIALALQPGLVSRLISARWLRFLGRYSYGLYIISGLLLPGLLRVLPGSTSGRAVWFAVTLALNLTISICSYHFLEIRFLRMKDRLTRTAPRTDLGRLVTADLRG